MKGNRRKNNKSDFILIGPIEQLCEHRCVANNCASCYLHKTYPTCKHNELSITCRHCWLERIKARDPNDCNIIY